MIKWITVIVIILSSSTSFAKDGVFSVLSKNVSFEASNSKAKKDSQNTVLDLINDANSKKPQSTSTSRISHVNSAYVPNLAGRSKEALSWLFESLQGNYKQLPLNKFMLQLKTLYGIDVRYLFGVDFNTPFSMVHDGTIGEALEKIEGATRFSYEVEDDVITWSRNVTDIKTESNKVQQVVEVGFKENIKTATQVVVVGTFKGNMERITDNLGFFPVIWDKRIKNCVWEQIQGYDIPKYESRDIVYYYAQTLDFWPQFSDVDSSVELIYRGPNSRIKDCEI
jgi:hypothetical protein